jgi:hypothetical protein
LRRKNPFRSMATIDTPPHDRKRPAHTVRQIK